jgi:excinuclease ABC subunit B
LHGEVLLYADVMTESIKKFLAVSDYRRQRQLAYNKEHNITPRSVSRAVEESLATRPGSQKAVSVISDAGGNFDVLETLRQLEEDMLTAANNLEFEKAALLRDQIRELKRITGDTSAPASSPAPSKVNYGKSKRKKGRAQLPEKS